jgi:hypothetical protein
MHRKRGTGRRGGAGAKRKKASASASALSRRGRPARRRAHGIASGGRAGERPRYSASALVQSYLSKERRNSAAARSCTAWRQGRWGGWRSGAGVGARARGDVGEACLYRLEKGAPRRTTSHQTPGIRGTPHVLAPFPSPSITPPRAPRAPRLPAAPRAACGACPPPAAAAGPPQPAGLRGVAYREGAAL